MSNVSSKLPRLSNAEFWRIYAKVPRLCVEVCILMDGGVVLTKRAIEPELGNWHIPGGTYLKGESLEGAVRRVAKAETGLDVEVVRLLGAIEYHIDAYKAQPIGLAYLVRPRGRKREMKTDFQASVARVFRRVPPRTVRDQAKFLRRHFPFAAK